MPIKGLTDSSALGSGLPRIAKLYKGDEKPEGGKRPGKDLDHFRVEFEPPFQHLQPLWEEMYGTEPDVFSPIFLTAATTHDAFSSWKEEWNATQTLLHRCDGEHQVAWYSQEAKQMSSAKIACAGSCGCKSVGRLSFLLPEFIDAAGVLGTISVVTHSINDILTVYRYLSDVERMYGTLAQIPFVFGRAEKQISAPRQIKQGGEYVVDGRIKVGKSLFFMHVTQEFTQERLLPALAGVTNSLPEATASDEVVAAGRQRLGSSGSRRMALPETITPKVEPEPEPPKVTPADWTAVWTEFKAAGFTPGNSAQIKLVFKVDDVMELTTDEALARIKAYRENKPVYGQANGSESH